MISLAFSKTRTTNCGCRVKTREFYAGDGFSIQQITLDTPEDKLGESKNGYIKRQDQRSASY